MKRKLNEGDVPTPTIQLPQEREHSQTFADLGLDTRLLQAVVKENFVTPTAIQATSIPSALEGKDILARANTGTGKTVAYVLPILEAILRRKAISPYTKITTALILLPSRELAEQVSKVFTSFSVFCAKDIRIVNLTQKTSDAVKRSLLAESPDVVVATPALASSNLGPSALSLDHLAHLVIDEADLVLSYGHENDLQSVAKAIPKGVQTFLMSATLTTEVDTLKGLFCRDPVVLSLEEKSSGNAGISQYIVRCAEEEKFLLIYVIFKLKLIKGKCIIFIGDIDRCYRLKLFLEQFGTKSCVLNSELPVNSRIHVVEEFNKNVYDIIIAADEQDVIGENERNISHKKNKPQTAESITCDDRQIDNNTKEFQSIKEQEDNSPSEQPTSTPQDQPIKKKRRTLSKHIHSKDFGISRGIDFRAVSLVLNFDLPLNPRSYMHRIGRTARAGKSGMALSFVIPSSEYRKHPPTSVPSTRFDENVLSKIVAQQAEKGKEVKDYRFDMEQVNAFRYRMSDALRAVTGIAVREARTRELRTEILKSEKLKRYFEENPEEKRLLRHDGEVRTARIQPHLKHVPDYLMPKAGKEALVEKSGEGGFVGLGKTSENKVRKARLAKRGVSGKRGWGGKKGDPLKTFRGRGKGKS